MKETSFCVWTDRVSSLLDGELAIAEQQLVRTHAGTCESCSRLIAMNNDVPIIETTRPSSKTDFLNSIPNTPSVITRILLLVVGVFILINSASSFIRGNTSGDVLHELRHLAIWQAAIGVAVISSAITFRISRILTVMLATFLALTAIASIYDLSTGHQGPWTDYMHVLEVLAVVLLLKLIWPQVSLLSQRRKI